MFVGLAVSPFVTATASEGEEGKVDPKEIIFEHLSDRYGWEVPFCHSQSIPLPIIVRDYTGSWHLFSSERLMHGAEYDGFRIATEGPNAKHIVSMRPAADGSMEEYAPLDLSVTKNVAGLFISALVVVLLCMKARRWYSKNGFKAPRKLTGIVEVIVEFIYFGVIRSRPEGTPLCSISANGVLLYPHHESSGAYRDIPWWCQPYRQRGSNSGACPVYIWFYQLVGHQALLEGHILARCSHLA